MERDEAFCLERADGRTLAYRHLGTGPPVVCLAGGPGADAGYLEDLGGLADEYELIIPDARGTGGSAPPATAAGYGFDEQAKDIEGLRRHLGLETMRLLAHSAACTTALVYSAAHPERIGALVLVTPSRRLHPAVRDDTGEILQRRRDESWFAEALAARARLGEGPEVEELPALVAAHAPAAYARWGEREQAHALKTQLVNWEGTRSFWQVEVDEAELHSGLAQVAAPVLTVTGGLDSATGVTAGAGWAECFENGSHVTIPLSGHNPWVDQPETFRAVLAGFLAAT